jgi:hypothetical protein
VADGGLPWPHWVIAIGCGLCTWIVAFLVKLLPDSVCPTFGKNKHQVIDEKDAENINSAGSVKKAGSNSGAPPLPLRGSFRRASMRQNTLKMANDTDRYVLEKPPSMQRKNSNLSKEKSL